MKRFLQRMMPRLGMGPINRMGLYVPLLDLEVRRASIIPAKAAVRANMRGIAYRGWVVLKGDVIRWSFGLPFWRVRD